jgi:hypothetical protein
MELSGCRFFLDEPSLEPHHVEKLRALAWCGGGLVVGDRASATHVVSASGVTSAGERGVVGLKADALLACAG